MPKHPPWDSEAVSLCDAEGSASPRASGPLDLVPFVAKTEGKKCGKAFLWGLNGVNEKMNVQGF